MLKIILILVTGNVKRRKKLKPGLIPTLNTVCQKSRSKPTLARSEHRDQLLKTTRLRLLITTIVSMISKSKLKI